VAVGPAQGGAQGEQKPDVFGDIEAGNEDTFCTTGPPAPRAHAPKERDQEGGEGGH
jgi:hypothetical protein